MQIVFRRPESLESCVPRTGEVFVWTQPQQEKRAQPLCYAIAPEHPEASFAAFGSIGAPPEPEKCRLELRATESRRRQFATDAFRWNPARDSDPFAEPKSQGFTSLEDTSLHKSNSSSESLQTIAVQAEPTLDDMLAATIVARKATGQPVPSGCESFARYAALVREGLSPAPFSPELTLDGIFLSIRRTAGDSLEDPATAERFLQEWKHLENVIFRAAQDGLDPFHDRLPLDGHEFAREHAFLSRDRELYQLDKIKGEQWRVNIPDGPLKAPALLLREPKSVLWKIWSRRDQTDRNFTGYVLLAVNTGAGQWVFSLDPAYRAWLRPLAVRLQEAECTAARSWDTSDPWFDGKPFEYTMVAAPRSGSRLSDRQILKLVQSYLGARPLNQTPNRIGRFAVSGLLSALVLCISLALWWQLGNPLNPGKSDSLVQRGMIREAETPTAHDGRTERNRLHVLTIGITRYADTDYTLTVARDDAEALAAALQSQTAPLMKVAKIEVLVDERATKDNILKALRQLERDVSHGDMVILAFAGHGVCDEHGDYFFLPHDFDDQKQFGTTAISWDELRKPLTRMPSLSLLIMDTCQSGRVTGALLRAAERIGTYARNEQELRRFENANGAVAILSASLGTESAQERSDWRHGVLTLAILEALGGKYQYTTETKTPLPVSAGEFSEPHDLSLEQLFRYANDRVKELTHGDQHTLNQFLPHDARMNFSPDQVLVARIGPQR